MQDGDHDRSQRLGDAKTHISDHQQKGQGTEKNQLGQRRRALLEERRRRPV
jgi:hypothetical protein